VALVLVTVMVDEWGDHYHQSPSPYL
jgi:hypothetical protein